MAMGAVESMSVLVIMNTNWVPLKSEGSWVSQINSKMCLVMLCQRHMGQLNYPSCEEIKTVKQSRIQRKNLKGTLERFGK